MATAKWLDFAKQGEETLQTHYEYSVEKLKTKCNVEQLDPWGIFVWYKEPVQYGAINFAVLTGDIRGDDATGEMVFWGWGKGDLLRECRHTYWGTAESRPGYLFYPDGRLIAAAFQRLSAFFDEMADASPSNVGGQSDGNS